MDKTHKDLVEREYIGTTVDFDSAGATFSGLNKLDIPIKKKKQQQKIEHNGDRKSRKNQLF